MANPTQLFTLKTTMAPFEGNGSTTEFAFDFPFIDLDDIKCIKVNTLGDVYELDYSDDYTVTQTTEGGQVDFPAAGSEYGVLEEGEKLFIYRDTEITQRVAFSNEGNWDMEQVGKGVRKLTMVAQELFEKFGRSITFGRATTTTNITLPEPNPGLVLAWNTSGDSLVNKDVVGSGALTVPVPISQGGTDADNVDDALFNLGFGAVGVIVAGCETESDVLDAIGAEPADADILKRDVSETLSAMYSVTWQPHTGTDLSGIVLTSNYVRWPLTGPSTFNELSFPAGVPLLIHVVPNGQSLAFSSAYTLGGEEFDPTASVVKVSLDYDGTDKTLLISNMRAAS